MLVPRSEVKNCGTAPLLGISLQPVKTYSRWAWIALWSYTSASMGETSNVCSLGTNVY